MRKEHCVGHDCKRRLPTDKDYYRIRGNMCEICIRKSQGLKGTQPWHLKINKGETDLENGQF